MASQKPSEKAMGAGSECPPYQPGTIRLYSMRWCPYAQRARIVLDHKNIKYEVININLSNKPEWYFEINPLAKVPALQIDDKIIFESTVVSQYVDDIFPNNRLTPEDPYQRAQDAILMEIYSKAVTAFYKLYFNKEEANVPTIVKGIEEALIPIEKELEKRNTPLFGGDAPSMVDFMMWPHMERIGVFNQIMPESIQIKKEALPKLFGWIDTMLKQRAVKGTANDVEFYKKMMALKKQGIVDYDLGLEE